MAGRAEARSGPVAAARWPPCGTWEYWDGFVPRDGDGVGSTSYKSGTTWMQNPVLHLMFRGAGRARILQPARTTAWLWKPAIKTGRTAARLQLSVPRSRRRGG
jgi:hypothetical protein